MVVVLEMDGFIIAGEAGVVNERVRIMLKSQILLDPLRISKL